MHPHRGPELVLTSQAMKLPSALAKLADRVVCSDLRRFKKKDTIGILFDAGTYRRAKLRAIFEQFADCQRGDYANLVVWGGDDEDSSWGPKAFRDDAMPFMLWSPDELFDDRELLRKRLAKGSRAIAFGAYGVSPQYQTMWFLHADHSVSYADIDGTFSPQRKSKKLVSHYGELLLRLATPDDISPE